MGRNLLILVVAAMLEVGGDALVRLGLTQRRWGLLAGALCLFVYGVVVNQTGVDFGRLMGGYIATFFVISQILAWLMFDQIPTGRIMMGGVLIVCGGLAIMA